MSRIKHFENLSDHDLHFFLNHISEFVVSEKVDGYNLLFGRDEKGFFTSRETRGGKRYYSEKEYPISYASTFQRSAHIALDYLYSICGRPHMQIGDLFEVEILYGKMPNVVLYDGYYNQCILLRKLAGVTEVEDLKGFYNHPTVGFQITIPIISKDLSKKLICVEDTWKFEKLATFSIIPRKFDLSKSKFELKEELLNVYVRDFKSQFGPDIKKGGWIEGLVFSHKELVVKLVDKESFTKIKNFSWKIRNSISERPVNTATGHSILGDVWTAMGESLGNPLLGTTQCSRQLKKLGISVTEVLSHFSSVDCKKLKVTWYKLLCDARIKINSLYDEYLKERNNYILSLELNNITKIFTYSGEIDYKTCQTFSETKDYLANFLEQLDTVENHSELLFLFIGKYLLSMSSINN